MLSLASTIRRDWATRLSADPAIAKSATSLIQIGLLGALAMLGAMALLPNLDEKVAALMADQRYDRAVALLEDKASQTPLNDYEKFSLAELYRKLGTPQKSLPLLTQILAASRQRASVLGELAATYAAIGLPADELAIRRQLLGYVDDPQNQDRIETLSQVLGTTSVTSTAH